MTTWIIVLLAALTFRNVYSTLSDYHSTIVVPHILHNGYLTDTDEVVAAKSAHLAALATQSHGQGSVEGYGHSDDDGNLKSLEDARYHGPTAIPHVLHDGHIANTHEVAAAKSAHLAALATQSHRHGNGETQGYSGGEEHSSSHDDLRYHGPTAIPHVLHNGHIADTHEVAAAKSAHLAALATQSHGHGNEGSDGHSGSGEHSSSHVDLRYHGPTAIPHVLHDGHIADTHEVAAAKSAHLAALATQSQGHGKGETQGYSGGEEHSSSHDDLRYHGPTAIPHVLHDGHIADTHEVAAAKSAHLAALATQSQGHGNGETQGYSGGEEHSSSHDDLRYHGPTAIPHVLHDGHIADTHEVAAAKSAHLAALATQSHGHGNEGSDGHSGSDEHSSSHDDLRYHGPTAIPHVLHDGHIADTHEVAAAKSAHLAALATQSHGHGNEGSDGHSGSDEHSSSHDDLRYHGPTAIPHVLHDGHIADTHEVAAARSQHFAAVAKAKDHVGYVKDYNGQYTGGYGENFGAFLGDSHHVAPYDVHLAKPVVLKSGYLADTHEVAAAKQHHANLLHSDHNDQSYSQ